MEYLDENWNKFDLISIGMNLWYFYLNFDTHSRRDEGITEHRRQDIRTIGAIGMFMMWIKMFYWGKLFEGPAYFITQIIEVMNSIGGFGKMYLIVVFAFANMFAIIQLNTFDNLVKGDYDYVSPTFSNRFIDSIV